MLKPKAEASTVIIDLRDTNKSRYFAITEFNNCFIIQSLNHCSFEQLNMSNHSLPVRGTDPPFSHKSVVSIMLLCKSRILFAGHMVSSQPMKRKEKYIE